MGLGKYFCGAIIFGFIAICITFIFNEELLVPRSHPSIYPKPTRKYWGKDPNAIHKDDTKLQSFTPYKAQQATSNNEAILDQFINLWLQREETNPFKHDAFITDDIDYNKLTTIEGRGYGINYKDFHNLVTYYNNTFNWNQYKQMIQSFNHNMINIRGINIHFIRHQLNKQKTKGSVDAILLFHGWPSSFWEFHRLLKLFQNSYKQTQIDIIIPSLPGYGFSEYPMSHTGFTTYAVAEIFRDLMEKRLSYNNYIVVGGDWGSVIAHNMAYSVVEDTANIQKLKGILLTMPLGTPPPHEMLLLSFNIGFIHQYIANKYNVSVDRVKDKFSPFLEKFVGGMWDLVGYQHEHATRANTIGIALQSSPISHLAWIYEKYLTWSDSMDNEMYNQHGNRIIAGQLSWDDVLVTNNIFYLNGKISSGIRYYTEGIWTVYQYMPRIYIPENIPIGVIHFHGDSFDSGFFEKWNYHNIVMNKNHKNGGHFPALEYPQVFYQDIVEFIQIIGKDYDTN